MRAIDIALIVIAVLMGVAVWTNRTVAVSEAPKAAVYGHIPHVAVPYKQVYGGDVRRGYAETCAIPDLGAHSA